MKKISQVAKEFGMTYDKLEYILSAQGFVLEKISNRYHINEFQVSMLIELLKISEITLESKMNVPEIQEPFEDFKKRTYSRHNS